MYLIDSIIGWMRAYTIIIFTAGQPIPTINTVIRLDGEKAECDIGFMDLHINQTII